MKYLSVSPVVPYDKIGHAGGKTYNYYQKQLAKERSIEQNIFCFSKKSDLIRCDLDFYGIKHTVALTSGSMCSNIQHLMFNVLDKIFGRLSFYSGYKKHKIMVYLKYLNLQGNFPDVIQLEWTEFVLFASAICRKYKNIKLIASEHDVSFQGAERRYLQAKGWKRKILKRKYEQLKHRELDALKLCHIVMPQSEKDKRLLVQNGIPEQKIFVLTPYYHNMSYIKREELNHDILFWGAMYRKENYEAALWFIEKVMPLLKDTDVRFVVAGNRPPKVLLDQANDRILVTGFVKDESDLFSHSMCFVSPLLLGAGIKVKVLEALSAGIPVLTNEIGIEGIPATKTIHYYHCNTAEEYAEKIISLIDNREEQERVAKEARGFVNSRFNLSEAAEDFKEMVLGL